MSMTFGELGEEMSPAERYRMAVTGGEMMQAFVALSEFDTDGGSLKDFEALHDRVGQSVKAHRGVFDDMVAAYGDDD